MKRLLPIILILALLLSGCGAYTPVEATPAPEVRESYTFSAGDFPAVACAPSLEPMAGAVCAALLGLTREEGLEHVSQSLSAQVWSALKKGDCSLGLAAAPEDASGLRVAEIARDALVFFVSEDNPVDGLTAEQIKDIYTGKITNWKSVGGKDMEITVFVKSEAAGSQAALEALALGGKAAEGSAEPYDNSQGAIGFGFWYYEEVMGMAQGKKLVKVDGVSADAGSIASGDYPFVVSYAAGVAESAAEDSPEYILWQWLQSAAGQKLIAAQGYGAAN